MTEIFDGIRRIYVWKKSEVLCQGSAQLFQEFIIVLPLSLFSFSNFQCSYRARRHAVKVRYTFPNCQKNCHSQVTWSPCVDHILTELRNMADTLLNLLFYFQLPTMIHFVRKIINVWRIIPDVMSPSAHVRKATNGTHLSAWTVKVSLGLQTKCAILLADVKVKGQGNLCRYSESTETWIKRHINTNYWKTARNPVVIPMALSW